MLDNDLGFELEEICDCHMYIRKECTLRNTICVLIVLFYISVFASAYVDFNDYRYVCSTNERERQASI